MLLDEEIVIEISPKTKTYLESLGYNFSSLLRPNVHGKLVIPRGTKFTIKTLHLKRQSQVNVHVLCDYCKINIVEKHYNHYLNGREIISKDCCNNVECLKQKREEVVQEKYGVTNVNKLENVRERIKETNLERRGVEYTFQSKEVRDKGIETLLERYNVNNISKSKEFQDKKVHTFIERFGVDNPLKNDEIKEKVRKTNLQRYSVEWPMQNPETLEKSKETCIKKYNVTNIMQIPEISKMVAEKRIMTLYEQHSLIGTSTQQIYLSSLLKGKLNYPIGNARLDIAFPEQMIYLEYDGSGHDLSVKFGDLTNEEFKLKEINRSYYLNKLGWKRIRIISLKDFLPQDEKILEMVNYAKDYLNTGHSWIHFDIDKDIIKTSQIEESFDYSNLRKIKKFKGELING